METGDYFPDPDSRSRSRWCLWCLQSNRMHRGLGCHETPHCAHHAQPHTALKYGTASCGDEYTPGNDHVGVNWISRKPIKMSRGRTDEGAKCPVTRRSCLLAVWCARCSVSWYRMHCVLHGTVLSTAKIRGKLRNDLRYLPWNFGHLTAAVRGVNLNYQLTNFICKPYTNRTPKP